ncbi:hypothetical protein CU254_14865 [Amycolatopsis sp. AA4]|uniref:hypothetical protein n=1 Tax=Actinomycetes TaxID=1760 RepID=UPI0001B55027|nr:MULTISPECIES: hypothetical protein [Actinomycetes]ATY11598.1 hypothetical protein CU254_14865 [Amycolatopsis sp. AA4]
MSAATEELFDTIDALRKENNAIRGRVACLVGYYGEAAARSGNPELAEIVRGLRSVLDGRWVEPGSGQ